MRTEIVFPFSLQLISLRALIIFSRADILSFGETASSRSKKYNLRLISMLFQTFSEKTQAQLIRFYAT